MARSLRRITGKKEVLTEEEVCDLLDAAKRLGSTEHAVIACLATQESGRMSCCRETVGDVDLRAGFIRVRPNEHGRNPGLLKTTASAREVPIWAEHRPILVAHYDGLHATAALREMPRSSVTGQPGRRRHGLRSIWNRVVKTAGFAVGDVTPYTLRHHYISRRLQMVDRAGVPVSAFTVAREVGTSVGKSRGSTATFSVAGAAVARLLSAARSGRRPPVSVVTVCVTPRGGGWLGRGVSVDSAPVGPVAQVVRAHA